MYPNLKLQLWRTRLRQNQLAKLLHIDDTLLSKIMNGYREPTADQRRRIAEVLHKDEEWLFETADRPADPYVMPEQHGEQDS